MAADSLTTTLIALAIYAFIFVFPIWRILSRLGLGGAWSLLAIIPLLNIIMLWVLAFTSWPIEKRNSGTVQ